MKNQQTPIRPTLHPYIPHLISDIQNAFRQKEKTPQRVMTFEEEMEEVENFVTRPLGFQPFGSFCGLTKEDFPPSEQLSDADMKAVIPQYIKLLKTWNADVHFPKVVPLKFQYELLIDILDEDFMYMEYGMVGFDFCSGNPEGCRWGEYCGCLQYK
ncbi:MAG: hypothetical protein KBF92_00980 [Bacteroidia bacterium]|jgi:hypothetical protein|nr:hypothetical protein [Candidatus Brachybacter algidus]MBP8892800.1 hypothetical protein [Saprospiraceae bacterium]MBP9922374.1 hypothetical protein [Bacteroidia bacterium]